MIRTYDYEASIQCKYLQTFFNNFKLKGYSVVSIGEEMSESDDCYKIDITIPIREEDFISEKMLSVRFALIAFVKYVDNTHVFDTVSTSLDNECIHIHLRYTYTSRFARQTLLRQGEEILIMQNILLDISNKIPTYAQLMNIVNDIEACVNNRISEIILTNIKEVEEDHKRQMEAFAQSEAWED